LFARKGQERAAFALYRRGENPLIGRTPDLDRAELAQMLGHELRVKQSKVRRAQHRDEMDQRDLGRVAIEVEHALAEEGAPDPHPIEPAGEPAVAPCLDRMAMRAAEELAVEAPDAAVDPRL